MLYGTKNDMEKVPESSRDEVKRFLDEEFAWLEKQNVDTSADEFNQKITSFNEKMTSFSPKQYTPNPDIAEVD
jgi:hypothetical protein